MKQLLTTLILIASIQMFSQTVEIDKICSEMDEQIQQALEEQAPELAPSINIESDLMERAIGLVHHSITIYFDEEEHEFVSNGTDKITLENVETRRKIIFREHSVSYDITYIYYYNEKGDLVKYVRDEKGYECVIKTYYFDGENVIKVSSQLQESPNCQQVQEATEYERTAITDVDQRIGYAILIESNRLTDILRETYQVIKD